MPRLPRLRVGRRSAVVAGLLLVLVPTLFSVFPGWTEWAVGVRVAVLVVWLAAAAVVVDATTRQGEQVERLLGDALARREQTRRAAATQLLAALLQPGSGGLPESYDLRVFLPDEHGVLLPEYESTGSGPSDGWHPGQGATGMAWRINGAVIARGAQVSDGTYGLNEDQQRRYADLAVVASVPIQNARARALGVLSVGSLVDDNHFDSPDRLLDLIALAAVVARVLIDVAGIERD